MAKKASKKKKPAKRRTKLPTGMDARVMERARLRCCLCHCLEFDSAQKQEGQIHHIDGNNSNNKYENLVWLCVRHHAEVEKKGRQSKSIPKDLVKNARRRLDRFIVMKSGTNEIMFEFVIDADFDTFTEEDQDEALAELSKFARGLGTLKRIGARSGSVIITVTGTLDDFERIRDALGKGKLSDLRVKDVRLPTTVETRLFVPSLYFLGLPGLTKKQVREVVSFPDSVQNLKDNHICVRDNFPNRDFATVAFVLPGAVIPNPLTGQYGTTGKKKDGSTVSYAFLFPKEVDENLPIGNPIELLKEFANRFGVPMPSSTNIILDDKITAITNPIKAFEAYVRRKRGEHCFYALSHVKSVFGISKTRIVVAIKVDIRYALALRKRGIDVNLDDWMV